MLFNHEKQDDLDKFILFHYERINIIVWPQHIVGAQKP